MSIVDDVRYAVRFLRKSPGFTVVALAALALGIGANSAMFSVVNAVLIRPLPYPDANRIGIVWERSPGQGLNRIPPSGPDAVDFREQATTLEDVAVMEVGSGTVQGFGEPQQVPGMRVSNNLFSMLGVRVLHGRDFRPGEGFKDRVGILSYTAWQKWFGGDPNAVGQRLLIDGLSYTLIGVLPAEAWLPLPSELYAPWSESDLRGMDRMSHRFVVLTKLKPGVTWEQASAELSGIQGRIGEATPRMKDWTAYAFSFQSWISQRTRPALLLLLAAVGLVLLIACTNVANLMLARAAGRDRDVAVRLALGASRGTLIRQFLAESLVLGIAGGAIGLMLAFWGVDLLDRLVPMKLRMPDSNADFIRPKIVLDQMVLLFTGAVAIVSGLLFGLAPAWSSTRAGLNSVLRQGSRGTASLKSRATRNGLVVAEIALAVMLLVGAGLALQSFWNIQQVSPGFDAADVMVMETELPTDSRYRTDAEMRVFHERVLENLQRLPGVTAVGMSCGLPMDESDHRTDFQVEGRPLPDRGHLPSANLRSVSEGFFGALRIPLKRGRLLEASDTAERPAVVVIDTVAVQRYFSDGVDPVGQRIRMGRGTVAEVVGVVGEVHDAGLEAQPEPTVYVPFRQRPESQVRFVVRHANAAAMASGMKEALYAVDSNQPVYNVRTMDEIVRGSQTGSRLMTLLIGVFAGVALLLASLGIYGVVSYAVTQRTNEIGIRIAMGAGVAAVVRLVMKEGFRLVLVGLAIGVVAAVVVSRVLQSLLFGVSAADPLVLAATCVVLGLIATAATLVPAMRAARTNPIVCLRYD
jgi:putative ABC transport system permease protein